jgi:hypothetical protein
MRKYGSKRGEDEENCENKKTTGNTRGGCSSACVITAYV